MICANLQQILSKGISVRELSIGGGLSRYNLLCQGLADLSALPVIRSDQSENTARGIAWLAANEPDTFPSIHGDRFDPLPNTSLEKRYQRYVTLIDAL
jgi:glycerol kinase